MRYRTMTAAFLGFCVFSGSQVQATVIETVEWESMPGAPWSYTSGGRPIVDCSVPPSPSGGCALKFIYPAGTYSTSFGGGRGEYAFPSPPTDLYLGHWSRYSKGFTFHPIGTKLNQFTIYDPGALGFRSNIQLSWVNSGSTLSGTNQILWGEQSQNHACNITNFNGSANTDQWFWVEFHVKLNTPGLADGIYESWINDVQCARYTDIQIRDSSVSAGWGGIQHTAEYGGGGSTVAATQYWWVDHTVLSTTRIGRPGSSSAIDSIPPASPQGLIVR